MIFLSAVTTDCSGCSIKTGPSASEKERSDEDSSRPGGQHSIPQVSHGNSSRALPATTTFKYRSPPAGSGSKALLTTHETALAHRSQTRTSGKLLIVTAVCLAFGLAWGFFSAVAFLIAKAITPTT